MVTVIAVVITVFVTWIVAKVMLSRKWYETGRLCVITNERTGAQSLAKLGQSFYADQEFVVIAHNRGLVHLRKHNSVRFYTPDGEVINEVNWTLCKPMLNPFSSLEDGDTMDQH